MKKTGINIIIIFIVFPTIIVFNPFLTSRGNSLTTAEVISSFSSNKLLSTSDSSYPQHVEPTLAIGSNNELFVGWKDALQPYSAGLDVSFTKSSDNGSTWSTPILMPSNDTFNRQKSDPWMNVYNNTIYYSYLDYIDPNLANATSQVTMAKSFDQGKTWTTSRASQNTYFADKETFIVSKNGTIYLTYDDVNIRTGLGSVKLSKSNDGGKSFSDISRINDYAVENILAPYPALSSNHTLFVSWLNIDANSNYGDVYYAYSGNGGKTFSSSIDLNPLTNFGTALADNNAPGKSTIPVMKFDSNDRLYVLWAEYNKQWQVYLRYSDDLGSHWSEKIPIHSNTKVNQWEPDMAIDSNNNLHIVWYEESNDHYRPYYREISFSGPSRSTIVKSSIIPVASSFTSSKFTRPGDYCTIRVDSNNIPHVVWTDGRSGQLDIYYAHGSIDMLTSSSKSINGFTISLFILPITLFSILRRKN